MKPQGKIIVPVLLILSLALAGAAAPQVSSRADKEITMLLVKSYDLLEAGKLDQAEDIYREVLRRDPGNPLALNNLGALMVKKKNYRQALTFLTQAQVRARGYRLKVNKVCEVEGACLAFRPLAAEYGDQDLLPLVQLNISLVKAALAAPPKAD